ncbi:MAG: glycosyl transferase, group 2 family [Firmicutes bacterium]|nr:glycosyl transferase, group 2 family [Bacillota bacterium]
MKLSSFILTKNNARSIRYAIESIIEYVDELIVVDSGSEDGTQDIVREYTDKIFFNKFEDFSAQRNFAIQHCKNEWIFFLDADEVVGENFPQAIKCMGGKYRSLLMPRYNLINLEPMHFILSYPHYSEYQQRFFRNDGGCYFDHPVHHQLMNSRPRLKLSFSHIFHLHFLLCDYEARKERSKFYESMDKDAGWPEYYLFEDFPFTAASVKERPQKRIMDMLLNDKSLLSYKANCDPKVQSRYDYKYRGYKWLTKTRHLFNI